MNLQASRSGCSLKRGLALLLLLPLAVGCSSKASITGKVTYQGKALRAGRITYHVGKDSVGTDIDEDGHYDISKVPTGAAKITVETFKPSVPPMGGRGGGPGGPSGGTTETSGGVDPYKNMEKNLKRYTKIPDKYGTPENTPLTYTVTSGSQEHDVSLE